MIEPRYVFMLAAVLGALSIWLMLPRGGAPGRMAGAVLGLASMGLLASQVPWLGNWVANSVFFILAGITVVSAVAAVSFRSPVYCAIWFGLTLLGTAGLFLFQGAQFLSVATVVVYAGAILVTFLFVLMLAQPSGKARYDRISWEALVSSFVGALMVGILSMAVTSTLSAADGSWPALRITAAERAEDVLSERHMAHIGGELFGRYLIAVEVAGTLLFAALVGAAVIVGQSRGPLVGPVPNRPHSPTISVERGEHRNGQS